MSVITSSQFSVTDLFYAKVTVDTDTSWELTTGSAPLPTTSFVGRRSELAEIASRLSNPACRLLTLVGPGGIGKTRLALEVAQHALYPDGVYFVSLQSFTSSDRMVPELAEPLSFSLQGQRDLKTWLLSYLYDKRALLVLDNPEYLPEGVGMLSEILEAAPGITLLVTSRERLHLREEWVLEVEGLDVPESDTPDAPEDYSAIRHFMQSALKAGYTIHDADIPYIVRISRILGGCPLGIELAAAWTRSLTCQQISHELQSGLDFLEASSGNVEPRHRSLRTLLEPTWTRLAQEEQNVFMRLSVFRSSFTLDAAAQVAGASLRLLTALVDKSLLKRLDGGRYHVNELLRQFGAEKLEASGMGRPARDAHSAYYAHFLDEIEPRLSHQQQAALAQMDAEHDNLRAAWEWMLRCAKRTEIEASLNSLRIYYESGGRCQEAEAIAAQAAAIGRSRPEPVTIRPVAAAPQPPLIESLTEREIEVLGLIAEGFSNQAIADRLILSVGTVKWYTTQIYGKLGVGNRAQAVRSAQQMRLLEFGASAPNPTRKPTFVR